MKRHRCPPWCHRCPRMPNREVMPGCMGTAVSGRNDFEYCTCSRPGRRDFYEELHARVRRLEKRVKELERLALLEVSEP